MAYAKKQINSRDLLEMSPARMIVFLYDETIASLRAATEAIDRNDIETRCNSVNMAYELVATLYNCLDKTQGGDVARNLGKLYSFLLGRLNQINLYNDPQVAEEAIDLLMPLRRSWSELDDQIAAPNKALAHAS
ncbi:flagellar export chaperone FliS [Rhodovibrionaceae bacterium A322]